MVLCRKPAVHQVYVCTNCRNGRKRVGFAAAVGLDFFLSGYGADLASILTKEKLLPSSNFFYTQLIHKLRQTPYFSPPLLSIHLYLVGLLGRCCVRLIDRLPFTKREAYIAYAESPKLAEKVKALHPGEEWNSV